MLFSVRQLNCFKINTAFKNLLSSSTPKQRVHFYSGNLQQQEVVKDYTIIEKEMANDVFARVNKQIVNKTHGRLFAVVLLAGIQHKITTEDLLLVRDNWAPTIGDKIRLEKVLLVGSSDFTIIGRPVIPLDLVSVFATVVEKTLTHSYPLFKFKPRKNYMKLNFCKDELTYLRITGIHINGEVNKLGDTDGFKNTIF